MSNYEVLKSLLKVFGRIALFSFFLTYALIRASKQDWLGVFIDICFASATAVFSLSEVTWKMIKRLGLDGE